MTHDDPQIAYSDNWLTLRTDDKLIIHHYYMPSPTRTLNLSHIKSITPVSLLKLNRWEFKEWGAGYSFIFWPLDWSRKTYTWDGPSQEKREHSLLIKTSEGVWRKIGVTCDDPDRFLRIIEKMGVKVIRDVNDDVPPPAYSEGN